MAQPLKDSKGKLKPRTLGEIPDMGYIVDMVYGRGWDFSTLRGFCDYTNAVVVALHAADERWGHLTKSEGQNHCTDRQGRLHSVDAAMWRPTGQTVDFIGSAGVGSENKPSWGINVNDAYPPDRWFTPDSAVVDPPIDPPGPVDPPKPPAPDNTRIAALEQLVELHRQRMEAINERFDNESKLNVRRPLPDYVGTASIFGYRITVTSRPKE